MFCSKCGKENDNAAQFCLQCGSALQENVGTQSGVTSNSTISSNSEDEFLDAYFGGVDKNVQKASYYKGIAPKFIYNNQLHFSGTWNWASFFFGPMQMVYRKTYLYAFLYYLVASFTANFFGLGVFITGFFSNYFIFRKYKQIKDEAIRMHPTDRNAQLDYLRHGGGVNKWMPIVLVGVTVLLSILFIMIIVGAAAEVANDAYYYY